MVYNYPGQGYYRVKKLIANDHSIGDIAYCLNKTKKTPDGSYVRKYYETSFTDDNVKDLVSDKSTPNLKEKLSKVILLGCPYNIKGYKGELSDLEFQEVTQIAIWQLTDPSINLKDKLPEKSKIVFDKIFKNLDNIKIPSNFSLKLYNYKGGDNYQNFISPYIDESEIPKIPEEPAKTIEVSKVNLGGQEITGAQIQIKNENGDVVTSWTS
ncbi:thioester-forming surface-anchored protein, partial [Clostridium perfringens]|nr:thioester-forming surface-anchored protein [Clostridium perfringens]